MNEDGTKGCIFGFCCGMLVTVFLLVACFSFKVERFRNEAVEANHAEYYLDENHNRQWRWKDGCE